ncbi:uncharacterized protein BDCG_03931 [Blastomyces dermatitidis ER-3]|uniref:Uncharacterized protein n=1 Tax=Ajellomyces dermatitidis (strain ER-3 / ATCC MYA-2586) TaxID=559297 RepID=A0ABP2EXE3_AJEDR|nr:uncharacterized protein BDCG_03931 [Blastomyces dermatitidis ER-3]EEQ88811.2 hypothetical protein BDCG_03931 [Blastomyces dermatitidis ER-3]
MKEPRDPADPTQQHPEQGSGVPRGGELQIGLLRATVPGTKLSLGSSPNDHTGSYTTVLAGGGGSVATRRGGRGMDRDTERTNRQKGMTPHCKGRRLPARPQKKQEKERGWQWERVFPRLIDTAPSASNLVFFGGHGGPPPHHEDVYPLEKHQNKPSTVLQG